MDRGKVQFYIKEYFTFTKGEKVGIITLISIILATIGILNLLPYFIPTSPRIDVTEYEKEIICFEKTSDSLKTKLDNGYISKDTLGIKKKYEYSTKPKISKVELNTADSADLEHLPGIGPVFAKRILKYRTMLGGYYSTNQLNEVFGLKPEIIEKVVKYFNVDTSQIRKIELNTAEFKVINAHPYISYEQTKLIMKNRAHKNIISLNQLKEIGIFSGEELMKLRPYLFLGQ